MNILVKVVIYAIASLIAGFILFNYVGLHYWYKWEVFRITAGMTFFCCMAGEVGEWLISKCESEPKRGTSAECDGWRDK